MRPWIAILAISILFFLVFYGANRFGSASEQCLTETYCVSSLEEPGLLAATHAGTIAVVLAATLLTLRMSSWLLERGYMILVGGFVLMMLGAGGLCLLFWLTPVDEVGNYAHILVLGGLLFALGASMVFRHFRDSANDGDSSDFLE